MNNPKLTNRSKEPKESESNSNKDKHKQEEKPRTGTVKLTCGSDVYFVDAKNFAACSNLIKKELAVTAHPRSIDLSQFDKTTVRVLTEYIESKKIKTDVSFYSLAELLKFSKTFEMENLRTQLEKFLTVIAATDLDTLHQVLLIIGVTSVSRPTERVILERAARSFLQLAAQPTFQRTPFSIVIPLFARCDLKVNSEVDVVDAMLLWLAGQANLAFVAPSLFYLVRYDFIHPVQKAFIIERARALRFPEDVIVAIEGCFECGNGARICVLKEHYEAKYTRCGIADTSSSDAREPKMPLSLPRPVIIYKPPPADAVPAPKPGSRTFHSSEARPYFHEPSFKDKYGRKRSKRKTNRQSSSKSGSQRSNRSKRENNAHTPGKGKKSTRDKGDKKQ